MTPSYFPATYWGGPIHSTYALCNELAATQAVELRVLTTDSDGPSRSNRIVVDEVPTNSSHGYEIYYCPRVLGHSLAPGLLRRLPALIRGADVVHLTAVYSSPTIPTLAICKALNKPVVWSPRGALQRWQASSRPRVKRAWENICNSLCDQARVAIHATSEKELNASVLRLKRVSAVVIPNGVEKAAKAKGRSKEKGKSLQLLYLGRLNRIKGIENLLMAVQKVDFSVRLSIYGDSSNGYSGDLRALTERLGIGQRVKFHGHVTGEEKARCFAESDVFIMPSFSESFGMATAEALSHGIPVIVSKGAPWSEVEKIGCGLWVENDPTSLAEAIERIRQMPLDEMGTRGREWMSREFSWDVIAEKMLEVYQGLVKH